GLGPRAGEGSPDRGDEQRGRHRRAHDDRRSRRGDGVAPRELGPGPHGRRVVGAPRHERVGGAHVARRVVRQGALPQRGRGRPAGHPGLRRPRRTRGARPPARRSDHRHPRRRGAEAALPARHRHRPEGVVPALQRAGRRLRPRRPQLQGGQGRGGVGRQRPEGVDLRRPDRRPRHAHRPHRRRRPEAPGHHLLRHRHAPAGRGRAAPARAHRTGPVQRGVPLRRPGARRRRDRWPQQRMGGDQHHADARAVRPRCRRWVRGWVGGLTRHGGWGPPEAGGRLRAQRCRTTGRWRRCVRGSGEAPGRAGQGLGQAGRRLGPSGPHAPPHAERAGSLRQPACQGGEGLRQGPARCRQHREAVDESHRPVVPGRRPAHPRAARHPARVHRRAEEGARRRHRQPVPRDGHRDVALRPGAADLRRHRRGAEEHHRRAGPRPAEGAEQRPDPRLPGAPQERV
ncbi:MAG: Acyl-CoA dehydrogenase, long-chain specific, partial [uncultured Acidimicrobiales bacterium]